MVEEVATTRNEAVESLALIGLGRLTAEERAEQLETMSLEGWSESPDLGVLPPDVRVEFDDGELSHAPSSKRYDDVLLIWLRSRYVGATNEYLRDCLLEAGFDTSEVVGVEVTLQSCPCCGRAVLAERNSYEICKVCWWEDDGQDNARADTVMGGPNYGLSLTQGRVNFLIHGISEPSRNDLRSHQDHPQKYAVARVFVFSPDGDRVEEPTSNWSSGAFVT